MPGMGYVADVRDPRDRTISSLLGCPREPRATVGPMYELPVLQIRDQGSSHGCVGFAIAGAIQARWARMALEEGRPITLATIPCPSALWLWWQARHLEGSSERNDGCQIRSAFKRAVRLGLCPETHWGSAHAAQACATAPSPQAYREAWDQRARAGRGAPVAYYRVVSEGQLRIAEIKAALEAGFPVVFGVAVDRAFLALRGHAVAPDHAPDEYVGNHAMYATGWSRAGLRVINSWGERWGNGGTCILPWSAVARFRDIWAISAPPLPARRR